MDSIMHSDVRYDHVILLLETILAVMMIQLVIQFCLKSRVRWAAAGVPALGDDNAIRTSSSGIDSQAGGAVLISSNCVEEGKRNRNAKLKVSYEPRDIIVEGVKGKTTSMDLHLELDCTRSGGNTTVQLSVKQIDIGVVTTCTQNCCSVQNRSCENTRNQFVIHQMTLEARLGVWAQGCQRLQITPHTTPIEFQVQHMSTHGVQMPVGSPQQIFFTWQGCRAVSRPAPSFQWGPASKGHNNEVNWTWKFSRYADGTRLNFKRIWLRFAPGLGIQPSCIQIEPGLSATLELHPNTEVKDPEPVFDLNVIVHIALLKPHRPTGYSLIKGSPLTLDSRRLTFSDVSETPQTG